MKSYRLLMAISVLLLAVFLMSCAKGPYIAKKHIETPEVEKTEKPMPPPEVQAPKNKLPEEKPAEVKPQIVAPPSSPLNSNAVGCVLPLTGRFADAGNKALDAVLLSSGIFNQRSRSPWKIVVADSGKSSGGIKEAVAYLADQADVTAIIAVSGTAEAVEAAREAEKRKLPIILITSKEGVTKSGEYVFQHFLTPTQQMVALTKYALDELNVTIFSILYPKDAYGEEMVRLFRSEVEKVGGKVDKVIPYSKTQTDFTSQIKKLAGKKIVTSEKIYASVQEAQTRLSVDFQALFIPDSPLRVKMITSQLAFYDIKGVQLLGTSLWHSPDLLNDSEQYLEGAVFADSFLVSGFLPQTNDFVDVYYSAYSREPENIEALVYDTMAIVLKILENQQIKTRAEFAQALMVAGHHPGATGDIAFSGNRVAQKNAFILQIREGKIKQVR